MPDLTINIGGHDFQIACAPGEENFLKSAVKLLDLEAKKLNTGKSKIPETKMLLMISLILADELLNTSKNDKLASQNIDNSNSSISTDVDKQDVSPTKGSTDRLTELISQAEALANEFEQKFN
jgi:cell division protein ZapA